MLTRVSELTTDMEALQSQATHKAPEQAKESKDRDCDLALLPEILPTPSSRGKKAPLTAV